MWSRKDSSKQSERNADQETPFYIHLRVYSNKVWILQTKIKTIFYWIKFRAKRHWIPKINTQTKSKLPTESLLRTNPLGLYIIHLEMKQILEKWSQNKMDL